MTSEDKTGPAGNHPTDRRVVDEAKRRRTIAIISHPDAGKSTLTESLLLNAHAVSEAGAVHGKSTRRSTVSDWMEMEKARGISISSAAIQFIVEDVVVTVVDTPGHADFSEDTYRVLSAVDTAVMLIDASKGMEAQTLRLFEVCRNRGIPIIVMINKWDRPGRDPLDLLDELLRVTKRQPMPLNWPVGEAGRFLGLRDVTSGDLLTFDHLDGNAHLPQIKHHPATEAAELLGDDWQTAVEEAQLVELDGGEFRAEAFADLSGMPVFFGAAVRNVGVEQLLRFVCRAAPSATPRVNVKGMARPVDAPFSAQIFKVQANMDPAHRDRVAFMRICSGVFTRGMSVVHAQTGRPFATKYALQMFGRERDTVDTAWPGDIVGLVNATHLRPGDTLYSEDKVEFEGIPSFTPELFALASPVDVSTAKKFRKGITALTEEGVVQLLDSEKRGPQNPVLGAVGAMQFEVLSGRMASEFGVQIRLADLPYTVARLVDADTAAALSSRRDCEVVMRKAQRLALFRTEWQMRSLEKEVPGLALDADRVVVGR